MLNYTTQQTIIQMFRMFFDILILWVLLYYTIKIVRNNSRTAQIFKGIILILIIRAIANFFGFKAVDWLAGVLVTYGFLAIIIIFQPEIRSLLEKLGKSSVFSRLNTLSVNERLKLVDELVNATMACSTGRVGALITLEQGHSLSDFIKTGTSMNSIVTAELLQTIFMPTTPLHDGAVIIQGDRIACASAYFPPTNLDVPSRYGARHRAAIGISEITDSVTIVVSEKSGRISIAEEGKLLPMTQQSLRAYLEQVILQDEEEVYHPEAGNDTSVAQKEEVKVPKPITFKTKGNAEVVKPTDRLKFDFKGLFKKKPTIKPNIDDLKIEEIKLVEPKLEEPIIKINKFEDTLIEEVKVEETLVEDAKVEEINVEENMVEETKLETVVSEEEIKDIQPQLFEENNKEVMEDVLDVVKKSLESERKKISFFKKKAPKKKVEKISDEIIDDTEIIINDPLDVKEEVSVSTQRQIPHVKLEYSVSDDALLDDEDDSMGGKQE